MSVLLRGAKSSKPILPQEKRVNRENFGNLRKLKGGHFYQIGLVFTRKACTNCVNLQKRLNFVKLHLLQNFLPQLAQKNLHGYILHIRDILQLCQHMS